MIELRRITEHYHLDKLVRTSASGSVFRATDLRSDDTVAVKLIVADDATIEEQRDGFLRTARSLQTLQHPAIPRVLDFGFTTAGSAFLVSEYLHGSSLEVFKGEPPSRVLPLLMLVAAGLEALEEQGIAHGSLRAEHVIVTSAPQGQQVKLLGLGSAALRGGSAAGPDARRADLRDLARLTCHLLGIPEPAGASPIEIPPAVAGELENPEALRTLLATLLVDGPEPPPSYEEVRQDLRRALAAGTEWKTAVLLDPGQAAPALDDVDRTMVLPRERTPSPPPAPAPAMPEIPEKTEVLPRSRVPLASRPWLRPLVAVLVVAALVAAALALLPDRGEEGLRPDEPAAPSTSVPPPAPPRAPEPAPQAEPQPELGEASLKAERREVLAADLAAALRGGDLRRLRAAVAAFQPEDRRELDARARKDMDRASRALEAEGRLAAAEKGGRSGEAVLRSAELLELLPSSERARDSRQRAAAVLEAEADAALAAGQLDAALRSLESLRQVWPERLGLGDRIERVQVERRETERLESVLAAAEREGRADRPHEGLRRLEGAVPSRRFEERFRQARADLEALLARLDKAPPAVTVVGDLPEIEKGKGVRLLLKITDDYEVVSAELWARREGGGYEKLPLRRVSGADYEAEISPDFHQNKAVELYVTARDRSGHTAQLGTPSAPKKIKRNRWWN